MENQTIPQLLEDLLVVEVDNMNLQKQILNQLVETNKTINSILSLVTEIQGELSVPPAPASVGINFGTPTNKQ